LAAERDARERALQQLADSLMARLGLYFHGPDS
jgi:hypothetical protein